MVAKKHAKQLTQLGMRENEEAALAYLFGFVSGIALLLMEDKNKFVRFHAMQSTIIFLPLWITIMFLSVIPVIGKIMAPLLLMFCLIFWLVGMYKAYEHKKYKFPIAGDMAKSLLK